LSQKKNRALYWPIGIFLAILGVVGLSIWTINVANTHPVVMDDFYFEKYQDVDYDYNKIKLSQKAFDKKYDIKYNISEFKQGDNSLVLSIMTKKNKPVNDATIMIRVTRPYTKDQDKDLKVISKENGSYKLSSFNIDSIGRWQILAKITVGDLTSFTKTDINATK
jgi:hypothetical protein